MKLIPIIYVYIELFTLKHSRFIEVFPLKHSRTYAETLPLTIYAYSYLYIKTCIKALQIVDNFLLKKISLLSTEFLMSITVTRFDKKSFYKKNLCSLMMTNRSQDELVNRLGLPTVDRLLEQGMLLAFDWHSYRLKKGIINVNTN